MFPLTYMNILNKIQIFTWTIVVGLGRFLVVNKSMKSEKEIANSLHFTSWPEISFFTKVSGDSKRGTNLRKYSTKNLSRSEKIILVRS